MPMPIPDHVPPELVTDFCLYTSSQMTPTPFGDPQIAIAEALRNEPHITWTQHATRDGIGAWLVRTSEAQRAVLQNAALFSSNRKSFSGAIGEDWPLIPLEIDPPEHRRWRDLLNPLLSPRKVAGLEPLVRARAIELIEGLKSKGTSCNAMEDFAFPFAVGVFLQFLGIPDDRMAEFVGWAEDLLHSTPDKRTAAAHKFLSFLLDLADQRRREPGDDFMTFIVQASIDGRPVTDQEVKAISILLFIAGLDTVAAAIGFDLYHLARFAEDQAALRADPPKIVLAAEEMLRVYPTITPIRTLQEDTLFHGVTMKRGDYVICPSMTANRDPEEFADPERIDIAREDNRHVAFGYGPHRCIGSHLARREIVIGIEEWLARIPNFRIQPGSVPHTFGGFVFGVENLILDWS